MPTNLSTFLSSCNSILKCIFDLIMISSLPDTGLCLGLTKKWEINLALVDNPFLIEGLIEDSFLFLKVLQARPLDLCINLGSLVGVNWAQDNMHFIYVIYVQGSQPKNAIYFSCWVSPPHLGLAYKPHTSIHPSIHPTHSPTHSLIHPAYVHTAHTLSPTIVPALCKQSLA